MVGSLISSDEKWRRRIAIIKSFNMQVLNLLHIEAVARDMPDPVVVVAHASAGAGAAIVSGMGQAEGPVSQCASAQELAGQLDALGGIGDLVDTLRSRFHRGAFAVVCIAWEGWTLVYPDIDPEWDKRAAPYQRSEGPGNTEPDAGQLN